jgi:serine/threonine protein kinase/tetratricopeptide (TPR) repeat protein
MHPDPERIDSIFLAAAEKATAAERAAYLDVACARDPELRERVERLLAAQSKVSGFLEAPAPALLGTVEQSPASERPGTQVGPYKLLEQIGEGGMGTVWMAEQTEPIQRRVAVKVVKEGMDSRQVLARFEAERQALALMEHPNIARVLDAGTAPSGRPYFVMELVKGQPITKYCDEKRLGVRERLALFGDVCRAVQHAHQKGIIHRDLKPSNVLVAPYDGKPVVKVIDFGVAKATGQRLTDKTLFTGFGTLVGTPEYMSPEQAEVNNQDIDTRSDIYSLGVLLYELLTGSTPLTRQRIKEVALLEVLRVIREEEPPRPSTRLSESTEALPSISAQRQTEPAKLTKLVRGELDWIVMKALEKDRNRRYETANGFAADVQRYLADEPVEACPPSRAYRLRKFARKNKKALLTAGAFLVLLVAAAVVSTWLAIRALQAEATANTNADQALLNAEEAERNAQKARDEANAKAAALKAEQQAREDEARARQQAFAALRSMTTDVVQRKFTQGAVLTEDDRAFLRSIIAQYDAFATIQADDADSRALRAEGRFRVGTVRRTLGELREAEKDFDQALSVYKQLAADFPGRPEFRLGLADCHNSRGGLLHATGRFQDAQQDVDQALSIHKQLAADFPSQPEYRRALGASYNNWGLLLRESGSLQEAEQVCEQALSIQTQLAAEFPNRPEFRQELARSYSNRGTLLQLSRRLKEAEQDYNQALSIQEKLAADFPSRAEFRQDLAGSHYSRGYVLSALGRPKDADKDYDEALSICKQLAADFPGRPEFRQRLAERHLNRGMHLSATGRRKEAEQDYEQALSIRKELAAEFPNRPEFRHDLARSHLIRGMLLNRTGRPKEAEQDYDQALSIQKQVVADFPNQPDQHSELASTCVNLASLHSRRGDWAAAKRLLLEGRPHHLAALKADPRHATYRLKYRNHLILLVTVHAGLLEQAEAIHTAETIRDLGWNPPVDACEAACFLCRCVPIVAKHDKLDDKQRKEAVQFYSDAAMKFLREGVSRGYKDVEPMKKETDLDPLRQREDFKKLIAELEGKGK